MGGAIQRILSIPILVRPPRKGESVVDFWVLPWSIIGVCLIASAWFILLRSVRVHLRKSDVPVGDKDKSSSEEAEAADQRKEDP
ncbi:hypothetical protein HGP14_18280 [Rhizobium sp. P32RR-XVIII]|uniref:hypothetical protein n=1 Tax=Rhizobium sp. P32RR-XVIII TaxID=2726738 RepID=UPI001456327E|nr:hypothetical protein [Rhizobium sp. P32RR-XVIII]NLS05296.1 hypothetical protein [Rhizobium sp. P32RR-XVIII]